MNKNPHQPKIKPYFPASMQVFSKHSYNKFLKTCPKHLKSLDFSRFYHFADSSKSYNVTGINLKNLTKRVKNIQSLDLTEVSHGSLALNVQKDILKRFSRLKKIYLEREQKEPKQTFFNYLCLKSLKDLKSLVLIVTDESDLSEDTKQLKQLTSKFYGFLQSTKLERIRYKFECEKNCLSREVLNFSQYPAGLKSFSLFLGNFRDKFKKINKIEKLFNLNHLQRLEKFEILTSLPLDLLNVVLESINDQLKTLAFKITLQDSGDLLPITRALLSKYQGLESLFITSDAWTDLFSFNEYPWKLKRLRVRTQVPDEESLKKLGEFIGLQQENIESLDLHLCFEKEPETFIEEVLDFFGLISRLKRLKTLKILLSIKGYKDGAQWYLHGLPNGESLINTLPISSSLIDMVNELKNLIILRLKCIGVDFSKDFERLFQALQQKSHVLEILEVNLGGYRIQKRDLEIMATTLLQFKSLNKLRMRDFVITESGFYKHFTETIQRCSPLRFLYLEHVVTDIPDRDPQNMIDMLGNIPKKSNLTAFRCHEGAGAHEAYGSCQQLRLGKIYKECPQIQYINLPINTFKYEFLNRWNLK